MLGQNRIDLIGGKKGLIMNENTVQKAITELKASIKVYRQRN